VTDQTGTADRAADATTSSTRSTKPNKTNSNTTGTHITGTGSTAGDRSARVSNRRGFLALAARTAAGVAAAGVTAHPAAAVVLPPIRPDVFGQALPPKPPHRPEDAPDRALRNLHSQKPDVPPKPPRRPGEERYLSFHNLHTEERLTVPYWVGGRYHDQGAAAIDRILRDWRTGEVVRIDRKLFDLLYALRTQLGTDEPFQIISGYRSPKTNAQLRNVSLGVAKNSYHVRGMAIDVRMPHSPTRRLYRTALRMRAGGVGYYPSSDFVHVDVGPVRTW
jgi:uncharacterized protein YcbK (DUF882 family)